MPAGQSSRLNLSVKAASPKPGAYNRLLLGKLQTSCQPYGGGDGAQYYPKGVSTGLAVSPAKAVSDHRVSASSIMLCCSVQCDVAQYKSKADISLLQERALSYHYQRKTNTILFIELTIQHDYQRHQLLHAN